MTYETVVGLISNKCSIKLDTLDDLADLDLLIKEIGKCYTFKNSGIDTSWYREGICNLPSSVWFSRLGYSQTLLMRHQGALEGKIPDDYKKYYNSGIPPKAILEPKKYAQYWI